MQEVAWLDQSWEKHRESSKACHLDLRVQEPNLINREDDEEACNLGFRVLGEWANLYVDGDVSKSSSMQNVLTDPAMLNWERHV